MRKVFVAAVAVALAVTACSSSTPSSTSTGSSAPESTTTTTTKPTEEALKAAAKANIEAVIAGDAEAMHAVLSDDCKAKWSVSRWGVDRVAKWSKLVSTLGVNPSDMTVGEVTVRNYTDTKAEASVNLLNKSGEELFKDDAERLYARWVFQNGTWRFDQCDTKGTL